MGNGRPCPFAPGRESRKDATPRRARTGHTGVARRVLRPPGPRRAARCSPRMRAYPAVSSPVPCVVVDAKATGGAEGERCLRPCTRANTSNSWSFRTHKADGVNVCVLVPALTVVDSCATRNCNASASKACRSGQGVNGEGLKAEPARWRRPCIHARLSSASFHVEFGQSGCQKGFLCLSVVPDFCARPFRLSQSDGTGPCARRHELHCAVRACMHGGEGAAAR